MRYTGIQPQYFPRLHYFARILNTDTFIIRDEVQFVRNLKYPDGKRGPSYQADSPIKLSPGVYLLKIPFKHAGRQAIVETEVSYMENWPHSHVSTIQSGYSKTLNFDKVWPEIKLILEREYPNIAQLNTVTVVW